MAKKHSIVVGLDIGTSKVCAVVGEMTEQGVEIIGLGSHPSMGLRKGVVINIESTVNSIKKAVEEFYGITVVDVNTVIVPSKARSRSTKAGLIVGRKPGYKKALVTVAEGETIDLYSNI